MAVKITD